MTPPQPTQFTPPPKKKRLSVAQIVLIAAALGFAAYYLIASMATPPPEFDYVRAATLGARYSGDCLIIRDEVPYDAEGVTSVDYIAEEGSRVQMRETICNVYSSGFSTREMRTLQEYRDQIKEYQVKLLNAEITTDARIEKLERDVLTQARAVREIIGGARGNMNNQERQLSEAIQARQAYLKEKYSSDQRMTRLYDDEQSQLQRINSWTKQYTAQSAGVVSFYLDGYEYGLSVNNYDQFTPAEIRSMISGNKPAASSLQKGKTGIYRLVKDGYWYVVMLIRSSDWNPAEGTEYELRLENFKDTTVRARVESFTRSGDELVVRMSVQSQVEPVLYVRCCSGVVGESVTGLTVPEKAIYYQDNMPGVVLMDGDYEWFIPVNIQEKRDGMCFIAAIQPGVLFEGQKIRLFNK